MNPKTSLRSFLALTGSALLVVSSVNATQYWVGTGSDANWSTPANWGGDVIPVWTTAINFGGTNVGGTAAGTAPAAQTSPINDLAAVTNIKGILLTNNGTAGRTQAFTLSGNSILLGTGTNDSITTTAISGANPAIEDVIELNIDFGTAAAANHNRVFNTGTNHNLKIDGILSGAGSPGSAPWAYVMMKQGLGKLTLTNANNSYQGYTNITGGTGSVGSSVLEITSIANGGGNSSIGASSNAAANLRFSYAVNGALTNTLRYIGGTNGSTDRSIYLSGNTGSSVATNSAIESSGAGTLSFTRSAAIEFSNPGVPRNLHLGGTNTDDNVFHLKLSNNGAGVSSFTKQGDGKWILTNSHTYTGVTTIAGGKLTLGVTDCLANTSNVVIGAGTLEVGAGFTDTVGTLDCTGAATINLGDSSSQLTFADSFAVDWTDTDPDGTLNITGAFVSGASLKFGDGTPGTGLNASQLAAITINSVPGSYSLDGSGYLVAGGGTSTVSASPTAVPADGTTTSTITVTLKDAGNSPVAGKEVSLSGNGSATITTGNNISNASGVVTFTVKSSTVGTEQFTATNVTDGNLVITQTASVDFQQVVVVGPVSAANSTVSASPASVVANGIATSTITVTLRDGNGVLISGEGVTLAGSPAGATISPAGAQITNASGQAAFTVKSNTIGTVTFTATSVTNPTVIDQTANVGFVDPATATAYNVKFLDNEMNGVTPATPQPPVTNPIGVVGNAGETWNQGFTPMSNLLNTAGNASTVSVSGLGNDGRMFAGAGLSIYNGGFGFFGKGLDTNISITGLTPNTAYDLYIYSLGSSSAWGDPTNTERAAGDFVTTNTVNGNGQSQWLDNGKAGTNSDAFLINGNYVAFQSIVADGSGNISILVDAYDGIIGTSGTAVGACRLQVSGLQIRPASGASFDYTTWRWNQFPGIGLPEEDDDGDGLTNGHEYIFGLDANNPASASPYPTPFDSEAGYFSYSRRTRSLINMNYHVWYSTDLAEWFPDYAADQFVESLVNDVEIMGVDIDPALLSEPRLFMQVRATPITQLDLLPSLVNLWGSGNTITLLFSEPMNPSSATNPANYAVTQDGGGTLSVTNATLNPGANSVTLTLASSLGLKTGYTVNIDRVTSSTGQSLGSGVSRQFKTWDDDPNGIKVFILAGQSNMVGYGNVETGAGSVAGAEGSLRHLAVNDASFPEYNYASLLTNPSNTASAFRTREDVKVWWRDPGNTGSLGGFIRKGDLGPPYQGRNSDLIGPEYAFGQILGDFYTDTTERPVLIVKCAWGGRNLAENFRPPSAVANRGRQVGPFYNAIIEQTREVLNNLGTEFPEWAGKGYQIVGFAWHQGYNDRLSTDFAHEYRYNLPELISDVRNVFNKPNLPFVIATTGMATGPGGTGGPIEASPYPSYTAVERAQLWVSETPVPSVPPAPAKPANVLSTDTRPFWRDAAVSPSNQGHHWNWNAQSYFLIGKGLGDNMVDLLTP